jgi:glyoxylase-like metal-dependent hydrolase (beta-lactamase superfamily II)
MNAEKRLEFPIDEVPKYGVLHQINEQIHWIRMPLPMSLNHVNLWTVGDKDSLTLIDTGMNLKDTKNLWKNLIKKENLFFKHIIATHMHPDHVGLAGWFVKKYGSNFSMSRTDYLQCRMLSADTGDDVPNDAINFYTQAGMTKDQIHSFTKRFGFFGSIVHPLPRSYNRLKDGDCIEINGKNWLVIDGQGHTMEHLAFFSEELNVFISGDQLLPTISSHVGIFPTEPEANPVEDWIESCNKLLKILPKNVLVLPGHGRPFIGADKRLKALIEHHETSLDKLHDILKTPKRAVDVFDVLFNREIDDSNLIMATGESLAHLNCLYYRGMIKKSLDQNNQCWYEQS